MKNSELYVPDVRSCSGCSLSDTSQEADDIDRLL